MLKRDVWLVQVFVSLLRSGNEMICWWLFCVSPFGAGNTTYSFPASLSSLCVLCTHCVRLFLLDWSCSCGAIPLLTSCLNRPGGMLAVESCFPVLRSILWQWWPWIWVRCLCARIWAGEGCRISRRGLMLNIRLVQKGRSQPKRSGVVFGRRGGLCLLLILCIWERVATSLGLPWLDWEGSPNLVFLWLVEDIGYDLENIWNGERRTKLSVAIQ